jgi:ferric-dicitrate binding protein FerR (iron transport regulator)
VKRPAWRPSAAAKLGWRFREISFEDMPLEDVFNNIAHVCNVNIVVRWNRLAGSRMRALSARGVCR